MRNIQRKLAKPPPIVDTIISPYNADLYSGALSKGRTGALLNNTKTSSETIRKFIVTLDNEIDIAKKSKVEHHVNVMAIYGVPGSGKSRPIKEYIKDYLQNEPNEFTVIFPKNTQRDDWKSFIEPKHAFTFKSLELGIIQCPSKFVIFEEANQFPKGYISTFLLHHNYVTDIIILGDKRQSTYHDPHPDAQALGDHPTNVKLFDSGYYMEYSYRLPKIVADITHTQTYSRILGGIEPITNLNLSLPIVTFRHSRKQDLNQAEAGLAFTYAGSQGQDFNENYIVHLDDRSYTASEELIYTAFTRGKHTIYVYNEMRSKRIVPDKDGNPINIHLAKPVSNLLQRIIDYIQDRPYTNPVSIKNPAYQIIKYDNPLPIPKKQISEIIEDDDNDTIYPEDSASQIDSEPPTPTIQPKAKVAEPETSSSILTALTNPLPTLSKLFGRTTKSKALTKHHPSTQNMVHHLIGASYLNLNDPKTLEKIKINPQLEALIKQLPHEPCPITIAPKSPAPEPTAAAVTLRPAEIDYTMWTDKNPSNETRELYVNKVSAHTKLFHFEKPFTSCIPKQQLQDKALYELTLKERIFKSTYDKNKAKLRGAHFAGTLLFEAFKKKMNVKQEKFDPDLYLECALSDECVKFSKDAATLLNNLDRSDPDFAINYVKMFMKSQTASKLEKLHGPAKPGQTLACFPDANMLTFGPLARYIEEKVRINTPDNIFVNLRKSPKDLESFVKEQWKPRTSTCNDYQKYDQSQNEQFLSFEIQLMTFLNIPQELISLYSTIKMNTKYFGGILDIMRITGEKFTFLFNTYANIAHTELKYSTKHLNLAEVYGGDDMAINAKLNANEHWMSNSKYFSLKAKTEHTNYPTFCGWYLTCEGIARSPTLLFLKLQIALEESRNKLKSSVLSYGLENVFLYKNYERIAIYLPKQELDYVRPVNHIILKYYSATKLLETYSKLNKNWYLTRFSNKPLNLNEISKIRLSQDIKGVKLFETVTAKDRLQAELKRQNFYRKNNNLKPAKLAPALTTYTQVLIEHSQ